MRWSWKRWGLISLGFGMSLAVILTLYKFEWTGFGQGESVSTTTNKRDVDGNIVEMTTTKNEPRKNLWDWLSLLGIPLSLAILGYILQQQERSRAEKLLTEQKMRDEKIAKDQREIAADEEKEEILQVYFDRLSTLLIDKNILAIGTNSITSGNSELLQASINVIRARTFSILQRFDNDSKRINSVIRFLRDSQVFMKTELRLNEIDLSNANLSYTDFRETDLERANLSGANLERANLEGTNLERANLKGTKLFRVNLSGANLNGANLSGADLHSANLKGANLKEANLTGANLNVADLEGADLEGANLRGASLDLANLSNAENLTKDQLTQAKKLYFASIDLLEF